MIKLNNLLTEGKSNMPLWALYDSQDGRFYNIPPSIYFKGNLTKKDAEALANKYTDGDYSKSSGFYMLKKIVLKLYT